MCNKVVGVINATPVLTVKFERIVVKLVSPEAVDQWRG